MSESPYMPLLAGTTVMVRQDTFERLVAEHVRYKAALGEIDAWRVRLDADGWLEATRLREIARKALEDE